MNVISNYGFIIYYLQALTKTESGGKLVVLPSKESKNNIFLNQVL